MSWTTVRTFVAGEAETASIFNVHLRDNLNALRDYFLGAQDLGSNWIIKERDLGLNLSTVAHGMTTQFPTSQYANLQEWTADGGLLVVGLSEGDNIALALAGYSGSTAPTVSCVRVRGARKSGTTIAALAATGPIFSIDNNGTLIHTVLGSGNLGVNVAAPTAQLHFTSSTGSTAQIIGENASATDISTTSFIMRRSRGTLPSSQTAVLDDDYLGTVTFQGWGTAYAIGGELSCIAAETWTATAHGTDVFLQAIRAGTTTAITFAIWNSGNFAFGNMSDFGASSVGVVGISNGTAPTGNPVGGPVMYAVAGALKATGTGGTVATLVAAEPHCQTCGRDFVSEWQNDKYGHLAICMWCLLEAVESVVPPEQMRGIIARSAAA